MLVWWYNASDLPFDLLYSTVFGLYFPHAVCTVVIRSSNKHLVAHPASLSTNQNDIPFCWFSCFAAEHSLSKLCQELFLGTIWKSSKERNSSLLSLSIPGYTLVTSHSLGALSFSSPQSYHMLRKNPRGLSSNESNVSVTQLNLDVDVSYKLFYIRVGNSNSLIPFVWKQCLKVGSPYV